MQIGNKFRCYPSPAQEQVLLQWIGRQRNIYYSKVYEDQYFRPFAQNSLQHAGQYAPIDPQYSQFKTELTPYLSEVPSVILRNDAVLWKQTVWLTSELFKFVPVANTVEITGHQLYVDIKKFPIGMLAFKAHKLPVPLHTNIHAGRWHVSFNYDKGIPEPTDKDTTDWLTQFDKAELHKMTVGLDRDVTLPLAGSDNQQFVFSKEQQKHWQRCQARGVKGSAGWVKAKRKVARNQHYGAYMRRDVTNDQKSLSKLDKQGRWIKNGATAKSDLNKSILASTMQKKLCP